MNKYIGLAVFSVFLSSFSQVLLKKESLKEHKSDKTAIQSRLLNTGKGPAVHALRAQADKKRYQFTMKETCEKQENLDVKQILIEDIQVRDGKVCGVVAETGELYRCQAVILATGTYLRGRIIIGETQTGALDDAISLHENDTVTFLRLTFLSGRLW